MSNKKYKLHTLQNAISESDGEITEDIYNQLKSAYKLSRVIKWVKNKINDDSNDKLQSEKITAKQLFKLIQDNNININDDDIKEIERYDTEKPKILAAERKLLKQFNKTKFTKEQQEKYIFDSDINFNPYKQELTEYLKAKGRNEAIELQPHQRRFLEAFFYANLRGAICFWGVGTGKTLGAVAATKMYLNIYPSNNVFFILPPALMGNMANSLIDFGVDIADNRIKFYTYDGYYRHGIAAENSLVIIDEAHNFRTLIKTTDAGEEGEREQKQVATQNKKGFAVLTKAGIPAHKVMLMTGTPFVNKPYDIENLMSFAEGKIPMEESEFGYMVSDKISRYDYFKYRISHYMDSGAGGYFPNVKYHYVPLIVKDEKQVKKLQERAGKENPFYIFSRGMSEELDHLKTDYILNKIKENPEYKTIIFSSFIERGVQQMMDKLRENNIPYVRISGQESISEKQQAIFRFSPEKAPADVRDNLKPAKVLIITRAGAEGVDTSMVRQLFVISGQWNEALYEQIVARASRYKSHHALPEKERFVNVYKLFLCGEDEAKTIEKFNKPDFDYLALLNIINEAKAEDNKKKKKQDFSLSEFESSKKGSSERATMIRSAEFAKNKDAYQRDEVISSIFKGDVSADVMLFIMQKSKLQIINEFVKELDKIPQVEKTLSDIPHAKKIFDTLTKIKIKEGKNMALIAKLIKPLQQTVLTEFGKIERDVEDHRDKIGGVLQKFNDKDLKKKGKSILARNQEFFTSAKDARELVKLSGIEHMYNDPIQVLEPSAGHGALVKAVLEHQKNFRIDMVEIMKDNREILQELCDKAPLLLNLMKEGNFLKFCNSTAYDLVVMNPPFHLRKSNFPTLIKDVYDIDFVKRAYAMLREGGVLVGIISQHWTVDNHAKEWLESKNWTHTERTQKWQSAEGREHQKISALKITIFKITKRNLDFNETQEILNERFYTDDKPSKYIEVRKADTVDKDDIIVAEKKDDEIYPGISIDEYISGMYGDKKNSDVEKKELIQKFDKFVKNNKGNYYHNTIYSDLIKDFKRITENKLTDEEYEEKIKEFKIIKKIDDLLEDRDVRFNTFLDKHKIDSYSNPDIIYREIIKLGLLEEYKNAIGRRK
jgi:tRNA1(Val) A37 N6-methylase TrmN6